MLAFAAVAQLDRVLGYEPRGRGFNSCQPHQNSSVRNKNSKTSKKTQAAHASRVFFLCPFRSSSVQILFSYASLPVISAKLKRAR